MPELCLYSDVILKELKILFIKPGTGNPDQLWAMHYYAHECSKREGFEVVVLSEPFNLCSAGKVKLIGHYPHFQGWSKVIALFVRRVIALIYVYWKVKPDIVHVNSHVGDLVCLILSRMINAKAKVVLDIRSLSTTKSKDFFYRMLSRKVANLYDWIFVLNNEIATEYVTNSQFSVLPLGYDSSIFKPSGRLVCSHKARTRIKCMYYGSLHKQRKLGRMIRGIIRAIQAGCDIEMTIVGEGDDKRDLMRQVVSSECDKQVLFYPFLSKEELVKLIWEQDIGISYVPMKSILDPNLPLKTVEMLACGKPVIGTDTRGNRVLIEKEKNGFLIGDDEDDVKDILVYLWENGIPANMYEHAVNSTRGLSWNYLTDKYLTKAYRNLAQG